MSNQKFKRPNALKHGIFAATAIIPGEDRREFEELHTSLIQEWQPDANTARANDCLAAPSSATPGRHWYYRTERGTQKKCWHLSEASKVSNEAALEIASQTLQRLMAPSSNPVATFKNGTSQEDAEKLYAQFLEWKRRTGQ